MQPSSCKNPGREGLLPRFELEHLSNPQRQTSNNVSLSNCSQTHIANINLSRVIWRSWLPSQLKRPVHLEPLPKNQVLGTFAAHGAHSHSPTLS